MNNVPVPSVPVAAAAGASAQREYDKRSQRREAAIRARHPKLGGLILALSKEPAHIRVWAQGAGGERAVGAKLDELVGQHIAVLHDRRRPRKTRGASGPNIDHLVVSAAGVWVVDAKTHGGALQVRRSGGLFTLRVEQLYVRGRQQNKLVDDLLEQVSEVREALQEVQAHVDVRGALCFVGTELPWFGESVRGVPLVGRRGLAKLLKKPGDLAPGDREVLASYLATKFAPAACPGIA